MIKSCQRLRVRDCIVVDQKDIQDNPTQWWDEGVVIPLVKSWVAKLKPDVVRLHPLSAQQIFHPSSTISRVVTAFRKDITLTSDVAGHNI